MDRAERAARQWAHEYPDLETGPMVLLGRLGEAAQVIARDRLNPLLRASACNRANSTCSRR
jgi:hypothetical protein